MRRAVVAAALAVVFTLPARAAERSGAAMSAALVAYFRFGYARGVEDALSGVFSVGQKDPRRLPPITREMEDQWRQARRDADKAYEEARR